VTAIVVQALAFLATLAAVTRAIHETRKDQP